VKRRTQRDRPSRVRTSDQGRHLDPLAKELIDNFAGVLARCGYSAHDAATRLSRTATRPRPLSSPPAPVRHDTLTARSISRSQRISSAPQKGSDIIAHDVFSQLLTWWWSDPQYCLKGVPRALPSQGSAPSIAALVRRLGKPYTLQAAMAYLLTTHSIGPAGKFYVPLTRWVTHQENPELQHWHHFRALAGLLRTLSHNAELRGSHSVWFEYIADNLRIPASKAADVRERFRESAAPFLLAQDETLVRYERSRKRGERTIPMMIGVWVSEGGPGDKSPGRKRKEAKGVRRQQRDTGPLKLSRARRHAKAKRTAAALSAAAPHDSRGVLSPE